MPEPTEPQQAEQSSEVRDPRFIWFKARVGSLDKVVSDIESLAGQLSEDDLAYLGERFDIVSHKIESEMDALNALRERVENIKSRTRG